MRYLKSPHSNYLVRVLPANSPEEKKAVESTLLNLTRLHWELLTEHEVAERYPHLLETKRQVV
jgi:hypothetical protein